MTAIIEPFFQVDTTQTDLASVLQMISSLSRNHLIVQVRAADELGEIQIKGSMVLCAQAASLHGRQAFHSLLSAPAQSLEAFYSYNSPLPDCPLGSLEQLLLEYAVAQDEQANSDLAASCSAAMPSASAHTSGEQSNNDPMANWMWSAPDTSGSGTTSTAQEAPAETTCPFSAAPTIRHNDLGKLLPAAPTPYLRPLWAWVLLSFALSSLLAALSLNIARRARR